MEMDKVIGKILQGYQPACVVIAANELKLFDQLKQPATAKQVAETLNLDPEATERLLNSLTSMEIIVKKNQTYHLPKAAHGYLTSGGSHSLQQ
jgi:DNA-binding IclR family transcriptional regulator